MKMTTLFLTLLLSAMACDDDGGSAVNNTTNTNNTSSVNNINNTNGINNTSTVNNTNNTTEQLCDNGLDDDGDGLVDCYDPDCAGGAVCGRWLYTQGNRIHAPDGSVWAGRGANLHDTRSCNRCAWTPPVVEEVKRRADALVDEWGATYIRLLLEAYPDSGGRVHWENAMDDPDYLSDMVEVVAHIGAKPGVYVLVSLWIDPSLDDMGWPTAETVNLWRLLAQTFMPYDHVMFGLVNEPRSNFDGALDADCHAAMSAAVTAIREEEDLAGSRRHIITVQGTRGWGRTLDYYVTHPITAYGGENIAYETHVYNPETDFESQFEIPSQTLPVVIGEFGPAEGYMTLEDCGVLVERAAALELPWLAWTFHQACPPNLLMQHDNDCDGMLLEPTVWGQLIQNALQP